MSCKTPALGRFFYGPPVQAPQGQRDQARALGAPKPRPRLGCAARARPPRSHPRGRRPAAGTPLPAADAPLPREPAQLAEAFTADHASTARDRLGRDRHGPRATSPSSRCTTSASCACWPNAARSATRRSPSSPTTSAAKHATPSRPAACIDSIPRGRPRSVRVAAAAPAATCATTTPTPSAASASTGPSSRRSTSSSRRSAASAAPANPAPAARCSSCPPPGARTAPAATSTTRTTRSSPPRAICARPAPRRPRPRALRLQPLHGLRARGPPLRRPHARRRARLPHVLRLAGLRPHARPAATRRITGPGVCHQTSEMAPWFLLDVVAAARDAMRSGGRLTFTTTHDNDCAQLTISGATTPVVVSIPFTTA